MWLPQTVERALFSWQKWRNSIIKNWVGWRYDQVIPTDWLETEVARELKQVGLPELSILEIYWICCLASNYNLDYPDTYARIVIPEGLKKDKYKTNTDVKVYPPRVIDEKDLRLISHQYGFQKDDLIALYSNSFSNTILLKSDHELLNVLNGLRGRPKTVGKHGPLPRYHDRLAVQCAALKAEGTSYVEIAKKLHLRVTRPYSSDQSDVTINLVQRGRKLLGELL